MRSDAVSLEVPVKVHGSRVDNAASGATAKTEPFEEQTSTMIVFPQGGVLKMATPVTAGQMMVVTNLKSGHDSICRIVKVRAYGQGQSYVEIEFTHRQPGYWGVYFPSDGVEGANHTAAVSPAAPAVQPISTEVRVEKAGERTASDIATSLAKPSVVKSAGPATRPDSVFAPIGSQEQVQPAASATSSRVKQSSLTELEGAHPDFETATRGSAVDSLGVGSVSPAASVSIGELQGDMDASPAFSFAGAGVPGEVAESAPAHSAQPTGHLSIMPTLGGGHAGLKEPAGSALDPSALGMSGRTTEVSQGKVIAVSAFALMALAVGAAYYFHFFSFGSKSAVKPLSTVSAPPVAPDLAAQTNPVQQPENPASSPVGQANPLSQPPAIPGTAVASAPSARVNATAPPRPTKSAAAAAVVEAAPPNTPAAENTAPKVPDMFGALHAHPTSRSYSADSGQGEATPSVDAPAVETSDAELPQTTESSAIEPPSAESQGPVRIHVGGALKPPRLVSSVLPVYPPVARDAGIEGDVVIDTTIDKVGKVTSMKVVSGPPMLRQAALEALRQWKYEPSKLNGEPVPVQMTVTIRFHRQ